MPTVDSRTVTVRLQNQVYNKIAEKAKASGQTVNAFFNALAREAAADDIAFVPLAVPGAIETPQEAPESVDVPQEVPESVDVPHGRLYGVALTLVDDLVREGYPESEIEGVFTSARREML